LRVDSIPTKRLAGKGFLNFMCKISDKGLVGKMIQLEKGRNKNRFFFRNS
jgi:hypothetical protein